jgi:transposase
MGVILGFGEFLMRSNEVAEFLGVSNRYVVTLTKKSLEKGLCYIEYKGEVFYFREKIAKGGNRGKVYEYERISNINAPTKKVQKSSVVAGDVPEINIKSASFEEKLAIVKYYLRNNSSYLAIAKFLIMRANSDMKPESLARKIKMWVEKYRKEGIEGLRDKRGGRRFSKIREDWFLASLVKAGRIKSAYLRYAFMEAKESGREVDVFNLKASVSYQSFVKYFNKVKDDPVIKAIMKGRDSVNELVVKFKIPKHYPNACWEIDATKLDLMVKVPVIDNKEEWYRRVESEEYKLVRYSLIGIVDRFSGARVYTLAKSDTSYADVRLLEKAIRKLGMPEMIKGDNGRNYVSGHFQDVLQRLGIEWVSANAYRGSEKPFVERGFRSIQHYSVFENLPGFIGHNVEERVRIENQAVRRSERRGKTKTFLKEEFMWWWEAERVIDGIINHLFEDKFSMHEARSEIDENLHYKLGRRYVRKLQLRGIFINGRYYVPDSEIWNLAKLGSEVEIYEEIDDISKVYIRVETADGERFIEAVDEEVANISVEEAKERVRSYKKSVLKTIKEQIRKGEDNLSELQEEIKRQAIKKSEIEEVKPKIKKKRKNDEEIVEFIKSVVGL